MSDADRQRELKFFKLVVELLEENPDLATPHGVSFHTGTRSCDIYFYEFSGQTLDDAQAWCAALGKKPMVHVPPPNDSLWRSDEYDDDRRIGIVYGGKDAK